MTGITIKYLNRLHRALKNSGAVQYINAYYSTRQLPKYQNMGIVELENNIKSLSLFQNNESILGKIYALKELKYEKQLRFKFLQSICEE